MTLDQALKSGTEAIGRHEARLLLCHVAGLTLSELILKSNQPLDIKAEGAFFAAIDRRIKHEPLQYIMGQWEFMGLTFKTDPRGLIPRPETELIVEEALKYKPTQVLDVCTGSGCIAIAMKKLSNASVTAIDISPEALSLARENATFHNETDIKFIQSDMLSSVDPQTFDIIISNPPYIPTAHIDDLQPELNHEPKLALDGGKDGMEPYRRLIPQAISYLTKGGVLLLEIGPPAVKTILLEAGYDIVKIIKDYSGHDRVIVATLSQNGGIYV